MDDKFENLERFSGRVWANMPFSAVIRMVRKKHAPELANRIIARMQNGLSYESAWYASTKHATS